MKDRIIEIVELGQFQSLIQRENAPTADLIKTDSLIEELNEQLRQFSTMPSLHSEPKTKDDMLLEILAPLGTEIPDPTGEYADLFAYLYDKISPLLSNEA